MPRSLYDNIQARNSTYIPKTVGSNFAELDKAASQLEQRYLRNKALTDQIEIAAAQDQFLQQDLGIRDKLTKQIREDVDHIASSPESFENSSGAVSKMVRDYATNQERLQATRNFQAVQQYKDLKTKLGGQGLDFNPVENFQGTVNEDGTLNEFNPDIQERLDYDKRKETFFNQLKANVNKSDFTKLSGALEGFVGQDIFKGITDSRVREFLDPAFERYKQTPEYQQERRKIVELDGIPEEEADDIIKASLLAVGRENVFGEVDQRIVQDPAFLYRLKQQEEAGVSSGSFEQPTGINYTVPRIDQSKLRVVGDPNSFDPRVKAYKDFEAQLDPTSQAARLEKLKPNIGGRNPNAVTLSPERAAAIKADYQAALEEQGIGEYPELEGEDKRIYDNVIESIDRQNKLGLSEAQKYGSEGRQLVSQYFESLEGQEFKDTPVFKDYTRLGETGRSAREDASKDLRANFSNRAFIDPENPNKIITGKDIMEEAGFSRKEYDEFQKNITVLGEYDPQNMFPKLSNESDPDKAFGFVAPLAVDIAGKHYLASRKQSELENQLQPQREVVNKLYTAAKELPGIQNRVELTLGGKTQEYYIQEVNGEYIIEPVKGGQVTVVRDLNDLFKP